MNDIKTYRDLLGALAGMTDEQLDQVAQIAPPMIDDNAILNPIISLGTVKEYEFGRCRSAADNKYHGDDVVLLTDSNPYRQDGAIAYDSLDIETANPIYGKDGPTRPEDQQPLNRQEPTK